MNPGFELHAERKKKGLCWRCGKPAKYGSLLCHTHLRYERVKRREALGLKAKRVGFVGRPTKEQQARLETQP